MGRIRTIKPEFWTAEQVVELSTTARLLFVGLWNFCDDAGIHPASPKTLKMEVFPGDSFTPEDISGFVSEMISNGLLIEYQVESKAYWQVTGWHHQRVDKPNFKYPKPKFDERSTSVRRVFDEHSTPYSKGIVRDSKGMDLKKEKSDFENQNGNAKGEGFEENTPLVAAPPPQPETLGEQVMQWAKKNRKAILAKAREVGLLESCETPEDAAKEIQNAIEEFCAHHAERIAFQENPILQFQEKYPTWFRIRVEKRAESKRAGKGRPLPKKFEKPICLSPNQCADFFRSRHGALAEGLTQQHKLKMSQCKSKEELSQAMEQVYEILKASANGNARRGPVDLGSVISQAAPAQT